MRSIQTTGDTANVVGQVTFTGDGISFDQNSQAFVVTGGGGAIPATGTGQNIVGTTVTDGNLTGVSLGTITASLAGLTTDDLPPGSNSSRQYFTQALFNAFFTTQSTTNLPEGTNLYFTDTRADARADVRIAAADFEDLSDIPVYPTGGSDEQVAVYDRSTGTFVWTDFVPAGSITQTINVNAREQIDSFFITTGGVRYTAKLFRNQTGSSFDLDYNATRRNADGTLSVLTGQATTQPAFDAFEANPSTIPFV